MKNILNQNKFKYFLICAALSLNFLFAGQALAGTYTVTNTNDAGPGSLRQAIEDANSNPGDDTIDFNISGLGPHTIAPTSNLPYLTDDGTTIDGYSQSGAVAAPLGDTTRQLMIEINGVNFTDAAFVMDGASHTTITGLAINDATTCLVITGATAANNFVTGNYIGTNVSGTAYDGPQNYAIIVRNGAHGNVIGGIGSAVGNDGNVIVGTSGGVRFNGSDGNFVRGNYIGTDLTGEVALATTGSNVGVQVFESDGNVIGGEQSGQGNIMSGNSSFGLSIETGSSNTVWGNIIGLDKDGDTDLGNSNHGAYVFNGAADNVIGGASAARRNIISGNNAEGLHLGGVGTTNNRVIGNYIGTDITGMTGLGNVNEGINIEDDAYGNYIGGTDTGEGNVIGGNGVAGVFITAFASNPAHDNYIYNNIIGVSADQTAAIPISGTGVSLSEGTTGNIIQGNVIGNNTYDGLSINGSATTDNEVYGNYIGTDTGTLRSFPNTNRGIRVENGATGNIIGAIGQGNYIANHASDGIFIDAAPDNDISGNNIFDNGSYGVNISGSDGITLDSNTLSGQDTSMSDSHTYTFSAFSYDQDGSGPMPASPYMSDGILAGACAPDDRGLIYSNRAQSGTVIVCPSSYIDRPSIIEEAEATGGFDLALFSLAAGTDNQYQAFFVKDDFSSRADLEAEYQALIPTLTVEAFMPDAMLYDAEADEFYWNDNWQAGADLADAGASVQLYTGYSQYPGITIIPDFVSAIYLDSSSSARITANTMYENGTGVAIASGTDNLISMNSIYDNEGLAIDLGNDYITENDNLDSDTGANDLQNFPVLSKASYEGGRLEISGYLESSPSSGFTIEYYGNDEAGRGGYGEGMDYIGETDVMTDSSGRADFIEPISGADYDFVTAIARDASNNTSEFSLARIVEQIDAPDDEDEDENSQDEDNDNEDQDDSSEDNESSEEFTGILPETGSDINYFLILLKKFIFFLPPQ